MSQVTLNPDGWVTLIRQQLLPRGGGIPLGADVPLEWSCSGGSGVMPADRLSIQELAPSWARSSDGAAGLKAEPPPRKPRGRSPPPGGTQFADTGCETAAPACYALARTVSRKRSFADSVGGGFDWHVT